MRIAFSLLRGICQMPAYAAFEKGFFRDEGLDATLNVEATATLVPGRLASGASQFAVMPWTRVAVSDDLVVVAGSGHEEAAIVVRDGLELGEVRRLAVPREGGIKDLTAMALLESLGWNGVEQWRQPSGDGAIIALLGRGVDAASMVEPYATMLAELGVGRVVRRTGDVWPGAPGCSLTTTRRFRQEAEDVVFAVVRAFARGADLVREQPDEAAELASRYVGIHPRFIRAGLRANQPRLEAIADARAREPVLALMRKLGYLQGTPSGYVDLGFLECLAVREPR